MERIVLILLVKYCSAKYSYGWVIHQIIALLPVLMIIKEAANSIWENSLRSTFINNLS
jgi:hypothetical protein